MFNIALKQSCFTSKIFKKYPSLKRLIEERGKWSSQRVTNINIKYNKS